MRFRNGNGKLSGGNKNGRTFTCHKYLLNVLLSLLFHYAVNGKAELKSCTNKSWNVHKTKRNFERNLPVTSSRGDKLQRKMLTDTYISRRLKQVFFKKYNTIFIIKAFQ